MRLSWRLAIVAGATPLLSGVLIFLAWYLTRAPWLMLAGVITIYVGLVLFIIGLGCVISYAFAAWKARVKGWVLRTAVVTALLIGNFPVAAGLMVSASYIMSTYTVLVNNISDNPIKGIMLRDPTGKRHVFGSVVPRESREVTFHFRGEGAVMYDMNVTGKAESGIIFGYVTSGPGHTAAMTIGKDGAIDVQERF